MVEPCDPSRAPRKDFKIEVYQFDQTKWMWTERPIGQLQSSAFFVPTVLSRDYLLGIAPSSTTFKGEDDRYYPFAIFKRDVKGTYLLDHYEDAGMGTPAIRSNGTWAYPFMASLWLQSNPIWIRDLSVIGSGEGLFWSFGPEGQFRGMAKIYEGLDDAFLRVSLPWNGALVDYQPNASGELVVSCLDSEAAVNGSALMAASKQAKDMDSAIEAKNRCLDRVLSKWHLVQWYKVQLPSGAKTRIPCPAGMPPIVANAQDYLSFNWAFQPNGIIKMNVR
jgi:hypothetical protein